MALVSNGAARQESRARERAIEAFHASNPSTHTCARLHAHADELLEEMSGVQRDATMDPTVLVGAVPSIALAPRSALLETDTEDTRTPMEIAMDEALLHSTFMIEYSEPTEA